MPRKRKQPETPTPTPQHTEEELAIMARYPHLRVVAGSLRGPGEVAEFGQKRTFEIVCDCGQVRRIASSDGFQIKGCRPCTVSARKEARRQKARTARGESRGSASAASPPATSATDSKED